MATGDNTLTAISVAKECNILRNDLKVYFGDVENGILYWKVLKGDEESLDEFDEDNIQ